MEDMGETDFQQTFDLNVLNSDGVNSNATKASVYVKISGKIVHLCFNYSDMFKSGGYESSCNVEYDKKRLDSVDISQMTSTHLNVIKKEHHFQEDNGIASLVRMVNSEPLRLIGERNAKQNIFTSFDLTVNQYGIKSKNEDYVAKHLSQLEKVVSDLSQYQKQIIPILGATYGGDMRYPEMIELLQSGLDAYLQNR